MISQDYSATARNVARVGCQHAGSLVAAVAHFEREDVAPDRRHGLDARLRLYQVKHCRDQRHLRRELGVNLLADTEYGDWIAGF